MRYKLRVNSALLLAFLFILQDGLAFTLSDPNPLMAPVGSSVEISGSGFDPEVSYTITFGDEEVSADSISENTLQVTIPSGAESGFITITDGIQTVETDRVFLVTKEISVTYSAGLGTEVSGYSVGTLYSTAEPGSENGFTLSIDTGNHSLIMADAEDATGSPLYGIARIDEDTIALGAESTVQGFALMTGLFHSPDTAELSHRIDYLKELVSYQEAVLAIGEHLDAGTNWLESEGVGAALEMMLTEFYSNYEESASGSSELEDIFQPLSETGYEFSQGFFNLRPGYPRELEASGWDIEQLTAKPDVEVPGPGSRGYPVLKMKMDATPLSTSWEFIDDYVEELEGNPLDWSANLYELDVNDPLLNDATEVDSLTESYWNYVYDRVQPEPLDKLVVPAKLVSRFADLEKQARTFITKQYTTPLINSFVAVPKSLELKNTLTIPTEKPGIYMIRSFSGAYFPEQWNLIQNLPGGQAEWVRMLALNLVMAVNDGLGIAIGQSNTISSSEWAKLTLSLERSLFTAINRQIQQGTLSSEFILGLFWETQKVARDWVFSQAKNQVLLIVGDAFSGRFGRLSEAYRSATSILGRVSSGLGIIERIIALTNLPQFLTNFDNARLVFAVEDSLVVIGNPWAPSIESFSPVGGYWGTTVIIHGDRYSDEADDNIITFGVSSTNPEEPDPAAKAEIVSATKKIVVVKVPETAVSGAIIATVIGQGTATTAPNDVPFDKFTVIPDPVITDSSAETPFGGDGIKLFGTNFPTDSDFEFTLRFSGATFDSIPTVRSATEMFVRVPAIPGNHTISMKMLGREIGAFPIEILEPPTPPEGLTLQVNVAGDGNVRDDILTLREAMMLADGSLGVAELTAPPNPRPPGESYEMDFVFGSQVGPEGKDSIFYTPMFPLDPSDPVILGSPLPSVTNYDEIHNLRIDGSGVTGQPFVLDGTKGAFLNVLRVFNSSQDGVLLKNGASGNRGRIVVENPKRHGLHLEDSAKGNELTVSVLEPEGNGIQLSGPDVFGNEIQIGLHVGIVGQGKDVGDETWGIVVEEGASYNRIGGDDSALAGRSVSGFKGGGIWVKGENSAGNAIGYPFHFGDTFFVPVHGNGGPGVKVDGETSRLIRLNVYGNDGHGIEIGGRSSRVEICRIGYNTSDGSVSQNEGSGIFVRPGSEDIFIGSRDDAREAFRNSIGGNRDHGILIQGPGTKNVTVSGATIGTVYYLEQTPVSMPNGEHGIAVIEGASGVTIGDRLTYYGTSITNHTNGAAVYLHGSGTKDNLIVGTDIGITDNLAKINLGSEIGGNATGIHITGGSHSNQIGLPGDDFTRFIAVNGIPFQVLGEPWNELYYNDIGIHLESGGDPLVSIPSDPNIPFAPTGANVVVNNWIGDETRGNGIGIKLSNDAASNRIGGRGENEGNRIYLSIESGILIDGVSHGRPERANRIIGNDIFGTGFALLDIPDPTTGVVKGAGIQIINATKNQIIGGNLPGEGNQLRNGLIGVAILNSDENIVLGNDIGGHTISGFPNSTFLQNKQAGVFILDGFENRVGPGNVIAGNGLPDSPALGGVYIKEGGSNMVVGNIIGRRPFGGVGTRRNNPTGITLENSPDNQIGFFSADGVNEIGLNTGLGIHIFGANSIANEIVNNQIGTNLAKEVNANPSGGILVEGGASDNRIVANTITNNGEDGVRISGETSLRNTIETNSITANAVEGIFLSSLANNGILPPTLASENGFDINGFVPPGTPNGSIVDFYSDPADEGETPLGFTVVIDEAFEFSAALTPNLRLAATLTDTDGNTSEFSNVLIITPTSESTLDVRRAEGAPQEKTVPANLSPIPVAPIVVTAPDAFSVLVESMTFKALGSIDESTELEGIAIYRDEDEDGAITSKDTLLSEVTPVASNDGEVMVNVDASLREGERDQWLLAVVTRFGLGEGSTIEFRLESTVMVESALHFSRTPITATGVFPVLGDIVTLSEPIDAYNVWRDETFSPEDAANDEISGRNADPDMDGIPNLLEFALGTDPFVKDTWNDSLTSVTDDEYVFQIPVAESTLSQFTIAEVSNDLVFWTSGNDTAVIKGSRPNGIGGFYLVVSIPRPLNESTPVFVRLSYPSS